MPLIPRSSYYDKNYKQSASLIRARRPYLIKNALTGVGIFGFAIGVYVFTIRAVSQDEFDDVKVPDAPVQSPHAGAGTTSVAR
ncbi:Cytochrome c oxidase assembly factor 3, mitochondrial [Phlyctema vagabunda]|uniref:Cytochrome c oxidase assembly factor 3 n=1 Tax=Phlyctema vagabunda TaxID=108571 RepID=A0ABR4P2N3_9HELO